MPSLIDWKDPRVVKLIDSYIEFDHVPPRFQGGTHPKSMKELGNRIEALFNNDVRIKYSSLQYQIPRRRRQLWLQFNPATCPEPHVTIGQGPHPFKENMYKTRKEEENNLTEKEETPTKPLCNDPPSRPANCSRMVQVGEEELTFESFSTDGFDKSPFFKPSTSAMSNTLNADSVELNPPPNEGFTDMSESNAESRSKKRPLSSIQLTEGETTSNLQPKPKLLKQSDIADSVSRLFENPGPLSVPCHSKFTAFKYTISLNSKLDKKLYVIPLTESSVKTYTFNKFDNGITYLKCNGCPATAKIEENKDYLLAKAHSAACKSTKTKDAYVDQQADRYARQLALRGDTTSEAYRKAFVAARHAGFGNCYKLYGSVKTQLSRWAGKSVTTEPTTLIQGQRWLLSKTDSTEVYMTDNGARALASCKVAVADATFGTSPRGEYQVLTVHALTPNQEGQEEYNPVMFALMKNKMESSYDEVFEAVGQLWKKLGVECKIQRWHTDYEKALMEASKRLVGESAVFGCLFHFSQAVLKKIGKMGLFRYYNMQDGRKYHPEYLPIRIWLRSCMAIVCLPKEDAKWIWPYIKNPPKAPKGVKLWPYELLLEFSDYMPFWIDRTDNTCTFHGLGRVRNTNGAESFHSEQKVRYPRKPRKAKYLQLRQIDADLAEVRLAQLKVPNTKVKPRNKIYQRAEKTVSKMELKYSFDIKAATSEKQRVLLMLKFARQASCLLHDIRNKSGTTKKNAKSIAVQNAHNDSLIWRNCIGINDDDLLSALVDQELSMIEEGTLSEDGYEDIFDLEDFNSHDDADNGKDGNAGEIEPDDDESCGSGSGLDGDEVDSDGDEVDSDGDEGDLDGDKADSDGDEGDLDGGDADSDGSKGDLDGGDADSDGGDADSDGSKGDLDGGDADSDGGDADSDGSEGDLDGDKADSDGSEGDLDGDKADSDGDEGDLDGGDADSGGTDADAYGLTRNATPEIVEYRLDDTTDNLGPSVQLPRSVNKCQLPSQLFLQSLSQRHNLRFAGFSYDVSVFNLTIAKPGLRRNVIADGNCGFRALSVVLTGVETNHGTLRKVIGDRMCGKEKPELPKAFHARFCDAKKNGERKKRLSTSAAFDTSLWMATEDIVAAAIIFNINIAVFNGTTWNICNSNFVERKMGKIVEEIPTVLLYNVSNLHFEAVLSVRC